MAENTPISWFYNEGIPWGTKQQMRKPRAGWGVEEYKQYGGMTPEDFYLGMQSNEDWTDPSIPVENRPGFIGPKMAQTTGQTVARTMAERPVMESARQRTQDFGGQMSSPQDRALTAADAQASGAEAFGRWKTASGRKAGLSEPQVGDIINPQPDIIEQVSADEKVRRQGLKKKVADIMANVSDPYGAKAEAQAGLEVKRAKLKQEGMSFKSVLDAARQAGKSASDISKSAMIIKANFQQHGVPAEDYAWIEPYINAPGGAGQGQPSARKHL